MESKLTCNHLPTQGLTTAQISRPAVAKMKMKTTASSFLESRSVVPHVSPITLGRVSFSRVKTNGDIRKQVVNISSKFAPVHIGKCSSSQYWRLQSLQFPRLNSTRSSSSPFSSHILPPPFSPGAATGSPVFEGGSSGSGSSSSSFSACRATKSCCGRCVAGLGASRGMMVLFEKQVHLQNEVGAICCDRLASVAFRVNP